MNIKIYGIIILPVILYGCKTWSLTLREERRIRVFEKRVLRRIFVPKKDEVITEWRRLHNKKLNDLYSLSNFVRVINSRRMKLTGHGTCMEESTGVRRFVVGKSEVKRQNIKMDIQEA
jgi:hypothetical protein